MNDVVVSAHDHGNCQLCNAEEERIRSLEVALRSVIDEIESNNEGEALQIARVALVQDAQPKKREPVSE